jgi:hypothetical protein
MAGRKLSTYVHVDGVAYGPDDEVPAEVAERITAPGVWADEVSEDEAAEDESKQSARRKPAAKSAAADDKG